MENLIITDFQVPHDWQFLQGIEETSHKKWTIKAYNNNKHGNQIVNIKRYFGYFLIPFTVCLNNSKYNYVIGWQQFYGIILSFYLKLFRSKSSIKIVILTFIYKPKKGLIGKLYKNFIKYALDSKYIYKIIVYSKSEITHYAKELQIPVSVFHFEKLGVSPTDMVVSNNGKYISAGRSNRDYKWLINTWPKNRQLEIICDNLKVKNIPKSISILDNCYDEEYLKRLASCKAVIIPLEDENISSGQLVMLQAMMLGKPIIVTENETVKDYVVTGYNGIIIKKRQSELMEAISSIDDEERYSLLSKNSLKEYKNKYSEYQLGKRVGLIFKQE